MQSDLFTQLPSPLLIQFNAPSQKRCADWAEIGSNPCLFFMRAALGADCFLTTKEPRMMLEMKISSAALRAFAGFIAFTLWLPFTIIGIVMCRFSQSHAQACEEARIAFNALPNPPKPVSLTTEQSAKAATAAAKPTEKKQKTPPPPPPKSKLNIANVPFKQLVVALGEVASAPSDHLPQDKECLVTESLRRLPKHSDDPNFIHDLIKLLRSLSDDELAVHLLPILKLELSTNIKSPLQEYTWLKPERWVTLAEKVVEVESELLGNIGTVLLNCWKKWLQSISFMPSNERSEYLRSAFAVLDKDPLFMTSFYATALQGAFTPESLLSIMTLEQIQIIISGIKEFQPQDQEALYLELTSNLAACEAHKNGTLRTKIKSVAAVPVALKEDPLQWIQKFDKKDRPITRTLKRDVALPLVYFALHQIKQVLERPAQPGITLNKDRMDRISEISSAICIWHKATYKANQHGSIADAPEFSKALADLAAGKFHEHIDLVMRSLSKAYNELAKEEIKNFFLSLRMQEFVNALLLMPQAEEMGRIAFKHFIWVSAQSTSEERGFAPVLPHIKTQALYESAIVSALIDVMELTKSLNQSKVNPILELLEKGTEKYQLGLKKTAAEVTTDIQSQQQKIRASVRAALPIEVIDDLLSIVMDYFLMVPVKAPLKS